ncbi:MAG: hypothetical protein OEX08_03100 [Candidatus Nomurabacteria bacterium]|nr:hypothetical protein [Candidatus Nomurabacteria bacterium]
MDGRKVRKIQHLGKKGTVYLSTIKKAVAKLAEERKVSNGLTNKTQKSKLKKIKNQNNGT